jgi:hypothetical protein
LKKIIFTAIFVFLTCVCFARGRRESFELGAAFPYIVEYSNASGIDVKSEIAAGAVNFSGVTFYTDTIGLGAYMDIIFPQEMRSSAQGQSVTVDKSAYDFLMAMDMLLGPVFMVYNNGILAIPAAVGFHYLQLWAAVGSISVNSSEFGLGANITGECHITDSLYLLARFQLTLDIFSITDLNQYIGYNKYTITHFNPVTTWGLNPTFGIGFKF